jgi:4-amino-4-deoxy-L-arabinose transferase-like glycosyltransferase
VNTQSAGTDETARGQEAATAFGNAGQAAAKPGWRWWRALLVLVLLLGLGLRLYLLVPADRGLLYAQDADEGVHATVAQLALQGYLPYRDFFTVIPPVSIYLFMLILRIFYHTWGSPLGLMAMRYASVAYGMITIFLVFKAASRIGGKWSGLLAAAIVAVDGVVVAQDRRAMLEAPSNMFSILAILCCIYTLRPDGMHPTRSSKARMWAIGAGICSSLALLTKGTAMVLPLIILPALVLHRRWREAGVYLGALLGSYVLLALPFLVTCPADFLKTNYVFHMLRPWDGTANPVLRLMETLSYPWSWTTTRLALVGVAWTVLLGKQARHRDLWLLILGWAGISALLLLTSRTYWATYFSQLAVPFAILAGLLLNQELDLRHVSPLGRWSPVLGRYRAALPAAVLIAVLLAGRARLRLQWDSTREALEQTKPTYVTMAEYITQRLPHDAPVLVFEPNYTFLTSHPPAGARDGSFFVDSYGEMLYRALGISDKSVPELVTLWRSQERLGAREVFHRAPAQAEVLAAFARAPFVVLDGRALKQLTPETSAYIRSHSTVLKSAYAADLRERIME